MVEEIYEIKNQFLERMRNDIEERGGIERVNIDEMYKLADIVKDLSEAEKACWEAEYYRGVSESMEGGSGYPQGGSRGGSSQGSMGYPQGGRSGGSGYPQGGNRSSSRRGYARSGYPMEQLRTAMQQANPQEREQMMQELRQMVGQMQ